METVPGKVEKYIVEVLIYEMQQNIQNKWKISQSSCKTYM